MGSEEAHARAWRVLVAAPFPPRLDGQHGGSRAIAQLLDHLAVRHRVALVVLKGADEPGVDRVLHEKCELVEEVGIPPVGRSFVRRLAHKARIESALVHGLPTWAAQRRAPGFEERLAELIRSWRPDVVQFDYRIMAQFLPVARRGSTPSVLVDYDPDAVQGVGSRLIEVLERRAWNALGRAAAGQADAVVVLTERDRRSFAELAGSTPVALIPLSYDVRRKALDPTGKNPAGIVSVGSFVHPPNVDAALWLTREIFPAVRARVAAATLDIVGSAPPDEIRKLNGGGVTVRPDVPDVRPYLDAAAVVAAPIRLGGGMRVKVLEALVAGKAIVATPLAVEGLRVKDGVHVVVAETSDEFADALSELLEDPERRTTIARAAREWAERNLDLRAEALAYEQLYASLLRDRPGEEPSPGATRGGAAAP